MPRRVSLPGADELFKPTTAAGRQREQQAEPVEAPTAPSAQSPAGSGRVKHDEKMTIYVTSAELMAVEQARLSLRADLGRNVDRGRLVRAALAVALRDLDQRGLDSDVARQLDSQ